MNLHRDLGAPRGSTAWGWTEGVDSQRTHPVSNSIQRLTLAYFDLTRFHKCSTAFWVLRVESLMARNGQGVLQFPGSHVPLPDR